MTANGAQGVLVVAELSDGKLAGIAQELLGAGRRLADALGEELTAAVLGSQVGDSGAEAIAYGADKVYVIDDPLLASPQPDAYTAALEHLCRDIQPKILLLGKTSLGIEVGPRLAFRLHTALGSDCTDLRHRSRQQAADHDASGLRGQCHAGDGLRRLLPPNGQCAWQNPSAAAP